MSETTRFLLVLIVPPIIALILWSVAMWYWWPYVKRFTEWAAPKTEEESRRRQAITAFVLMLLALAGLAWSLWKG